MYILNYKCLRNEICTDETKLKQMNSLKIYQNVDHETHD